MLYSVLYLMVASMPIGPLHVRLIELDGQPLRLTYKQTLIRLFFAASSLNACAVVTKPIRHIRASTRHLLPDARRLSIPPFPYTPIHPYTHTPIHPYTHTPIHPYTHSLIPPTQPSHTDTHSPLCRQPFLILI
jgi:hypothetical protein